MIAVNADHCDLQRLLDDTHRMQHTELCFLRRLFDSFRGCFSAVNETALITPRFLPARPGAKRSPPHRF